MQKLSILFCACIVGCGGSQTPTTLPQASNAPVAATTTANASFEEAEIVAMGGVFRGAMPVALTSFGAAPLGNDVYVVGGYFGEPHNYSREGQSAVFSRFTPGGNGTAGTFTTLAPMPVGLQGLTMVALDNALVRCGGNRIDNEAGTDTVMHSIAECARFDVQAGSWGEFPALPEPRSSFDAVVVGGRIYAVGGWAMSGGSDSSTMHDTIAIWEPSTRAWREAPAPFQRRALAVVALGDSIVAIGGLDENRRPSSRVDVYDTRTQAWSAAPALPTDGFGVAAATVGDHVYASTRDGVVYAWGRDADAWTRVTTLSNPRFFHRLIPSGNDSLLAIGGIGSMTTDGRSRLIESVQVSGNMATRPRIGFVEVSFPGAARNRSGYFVSDDSLWIYGGNNSQEQHDFEPTNFETLARRLHLPSLRWFSVSALPEARQSMQSVFVGENLLTFGGFGHDEDAPRTFANGFVLNRETGSWSTIAEVLPSPRTQFSVALHDDALWIFGGLDYDQARPSADQFRHLTTVLRCPVHENANSEARVEVGTCEEVPAPLPGTRRAFASAMLGDKLYMVGGMREGFAGVEDCFTFDFQARSWSPFTCPSRVRISADLIAFNGKLVLIGGSSREGDGLTPDNRVEVFDPATNAWALVVQALPFSTHQMRFTPSHDRILGFSTQTNQHRALVAWIDVGN